MHRRITRDRDTLELIEDLSVRATGLDRRADKAFKTPRNLTVEISIDNVEEETLSSSEQSLYRAVVTRINYLAQDRGDLQYASKECSRKMSCPTRSDFVAVKRIAKYLIHAPRAVLVYRWQDPLTSLTVYTDSNWAGCRETRKSTSGATFLHGGHVIKHYSRTQSTIALSSAESELYATVSAASEGLGLAAMCSEYGQVLCPYVMSTHRQR